MVQLPYKNITENRPLFYKDLLNNGITFQDGSCINFLSLAAFQNKYDLKARPLTFFGIISAIKLLKRHISQNTIPLKNEIYSRYVYGGSGAFEEFARL